MTEKRYYEELAEIDKQHPKNIFLPTLRAGHTVATEAYLAAAWALVPKEAIISLSQATSHEAKTTPSVLNQGRIKNDHPDAVNDLFRRKGHINREMRKIKATDLMAAQNVQERRTIMQQLDDMQQDWAVVQRQIRVWEVTKEIPVAVVVEHNAEASFEERIADLDSLSDLELSARLATARSCHSRMKKRIDGLPQGIMEKAHPKHKQWVTLEQKLQTYEREKIHIDSAIKRRKNPLNDGKDQ